MLKRFDIFGFVLLAGFVLNGLFSSPLPVSAASYDIYVDKNGDSSGDGSEGDPFDTIEDGIKKAASNPDSSRKIYIRSGTYSESFTVGDDMKLYGAGRGKAVISGSVVMKSGSRMENLTVAMNAPVGVTVSANADVAFKGVEIKDFTQISLNSLPGNGKLSVIDSVIHGGGGKGIFVQKGKRIEIAGNKIYGNKEEGLDIRDDVSGTVQDNDIHDNRESGIELIIGSSDLSIVKNNISGNTASGIATQFYSSATIIGKIDIRGNTIQKNGNYAIDCKVPSGGKPGRDYWNKSLSFADNSLSGKSDRVIAGSCNIEETADMDDNDGDTDDAVKKDASEKVSKVTSPKALPDAPDKTESVADAVSVNEASLQEESRIEQEIASLKEGQDGSIARADALQEAIRSQNQVRRFFFGSDLERMLDLRSEVRLAEERASALEGLSNRIGDEEDGSGIRAALVQEEAHIAEWNDFIGQNDRWGTFVDWIRRIRFLF